MFFLLQILLLKKLFHKKQLLALLTLFILLIPMLDGIASAKTTARFKQISLLTQSNSSLSQKTYTFIKSYLAHFSPIFLFTKGDIDFPGQFITRHSVRGMGELYWWQAPFLVLGVLGIIIKKDFLKKNNALIILGIWFFLYPFGTALTTTISPQANRSFIGVIPFQILTAFGIVYFYNLIFRSLTKLHGRVILSKSVFYLLTSIFAFIVTTSFTYYLTLYFIRYPTYAADFWGWQYGPREIVGYFKKHHQEYDELYLSPEFNAPEIFLKFYDPEKECNNCL